MYEAFELQRVVEKLPLKICALATWGDYFMVSTVSPKGEAHLLVYQLKLSSASHEYSAGLNKTLKKFTSKPITQLAVIPEYSIFLGLADNEVFYADLEVFMIMGHLPRSRGASGFAVDWLKLRGQVGFINRDLRLCLAFKKKITVYKLEKNKFIIKNELAFPDTPRGMAWVGDNIFLCMKKDLYLTTLEGETKELISIGNTRVDPVLYPMMNGELVVLRDEMQVSYDSQGKPTQTVPINWSELPSDVEHVQPYMVALLPKGVEVRALEQKIHVQSIRIPSVKFIASSKSTLIATQDYVYKLEPRPYDGQILSCIDQKQFELALCLAELIDEPPLEAKIRREGILRRLAFYQFTQTKFEESLKNYQEIHEKPMNVIGLYPNLIPGDLRQKVAEQHPTKPPTMSGEDLEEGLKHLVGYLTHMRYQEMQRFVRHQKAKKGEEQPEHELDKEGFKQLSNSLQLLDTTLLKCYIKLKRTTMIGSLVRLPDNFLHQGESERVLRQENHFEELIDLYKSKGDHRKALEQLKQFSSGPNSPLTGVEPTINYLQSLGSEHIQIILENSEWVFKTDSVQALKIFTEDVEDVKSLPRKQVLPHLEKHAPHRVIPYLEYIIHKWGEEGGVFHNKLVKMYQTKIEKLLVEYKHKYEHRQRAKAGEEPGELGKLRSKLLKFLSWSRHYEAAEHISTFPRDELFEERALLLSRLGRHEVALAIYAHILKEPELAEEYCQVNYDPDREDSRDVYLCLINMYLSPPKLEEYGISVDKSERPVRNVKAALDVLTSHHHLMDTTKVLELLPADTKLCEIHRFLCTVVQEKTNRKRRTQLMKSLLLAEHLQVAQEKIKTEAPSFIIGDTDVCDACRKRLGTSALVRYPNGVVEHYYCAKGNLTRSEASPNNQPAPSSISAPQDSLNAPLGSSLANSGMGLLAEATGMDWTPPPGLEFNQDWFDIERPEKNRFT